MMSGSGFELSASSDEVFESMRSATSAISSSGFSSSFCAEVPMAISSPSARIRCSSSRVPRNGLIVFR